MRKKNRSLTDWLFWMEIDRRDGSLVSRQLRTRYRRYLYTGKCRTQTDLVQHPSALDVPNTHHPVCATYRDPPTIVVLAPRSFQQGVFEPRGCALKNTVDPGWGSGKWTDVVDDGLRGKRGREKVRSVWRERERGGGISVPREGIHLFVFSYIVHLSHDVFSVPSLACRGSLTTAREKLRTWISLSNAPTYTCCPSALQHTAVTGHPTSHTATLCLSPSPSHTLTVPSSEPVATSSIPAPPAIVRSRALIMPRCARIFLIR